jgi:hypothetical protein
VPGPSQHHLQAVLGTACRAQPLLRRSMVLRAICIRVSGVILASAGARAWPSRLGTSDTREQEDLCI